MCSYANIKGLGVVSALAVGGFLFAENVLPKYSKLKKTTQTQSTVFRVACKIVNLIKTSIVSVYSAPMALYRIFFPEKLTISEKILCKALCAVTYSMGIVGQKNVCKMIALTQNVYNYVYC